MTFGVLEPKTGGHVPGTLLIDENAADADAAGQYSGLKHGTGRESHIILAPQPSDDPNDPLNWSWAEKHVILSIICYGAIVNSCTPGPMLQAGVGPISASLGVSFTDVAKLAGYVLLAGGAAGIPVSAFSRKIGKRPVFIVSAIISIIGCIIGMTAQNYNTLVGARVIQGLGSLTYESLALPTIGDLFFVHERGPRVTCIMFILSSITNGILVIAGPITANLGWHYNFHILLPFTSMVAILTFFFVPETTYVRDAVYNIDTLGSDQDLDRLREIEKKRDVVPKDENTQIEEAESSRSTNTPLRRKSYVQRLALYNGIFTQDSIIKMFLAPAVILLNLGASYNILVSGIAIAWFVGISIITTVVFSLPPYNYTAASVGYTSVAPFVGGIIGTVFMIVTQEPLTRWWVRVNKGVYEPEFRLPLISIGLVFSLAGLHGVGYAIRDHVSVYVICLCWGFMMFGLTIVGITTTGYALDAFREHSTEIFVMNMLFKNFFFYGLSNYVIDWFMTKGPTDMFNAMGGITAGVLLTTVPMYIWGKRYRAFWHRHNLIKFFKLETTQVGGGMG